MLYLSPNFDKVAAFVWGEKLGSRCVRKALSCTYKLDISQRWCNLVKTLWKIKRSYHLISENVIFTWSNSGVVFFYEQEKDFFHFHYQFRFVLRLLRLIFKPAHKTGQLEIILESRNTKSSWRKFSQASLINRDSFKLVGCLTGR